jgi:hypothetical protein
MSKTPRESASPACLAHEADDTYMGFASKVEIAAFLKALAAAKQAGKPCGEMLRRMLPKIRDEALYRELVVKLTEEESKKSAV